jgi:hypothetical protein
MATGQKNTYGPRRRFKGKRGLAKKARGGKTVVVMRSQTGSSKPTASGYECGQTEAYQTVALPGRFRVQMPRNRTRYVSPGGCA